MKESQEKIKQFNDVRDWSSPSQIKDLMLNMTEEIGEMWNVIKWTDVETQQKLIKENKEKTEAILWNLLYGLAEIGKLLKPFLPETSDKILEALGTNENKEYNSFKVKLLEHPLFLRKDEEHSFLCKILFFLTLYLPHYAQFSHIFCP